MQIVNQKLEDILSGLRHLEVDWKDETAIRVIAQLRNMPVKAAYSIEDILGDIHTIISAKRADTALLFFTDGLTWRERQSDMRKLVDLQNKGDIMRIYTYAMADQFEKDLRQLKSEGGL